MIDQKRKNIIGEIIGAIVHPMTTSQTSGEADGVRIEGRLIGALKTDGNLMVGERAQITADINAKSISVAGVIEGDIRANTVEVLSSGKVRGGIRVNHFVVNEGGFIDAQVDQVDRDNQQIDDTRRPSWEGQDLEAA